LIQPTEPLSEGELLARAQKLVGRTFLELSSMMGVELPSTSVRGKGKAGGLLEQWLGGRGGSNRVHDFPTLGIELKSIPLSATLLPSESTYVCTLRLEEADCVDWVDSWPRAKLAKVLFVTIDDAEVPVHARRVHEAYLYQPSADDDDRLRNDYESIVGMIATGRMDLLTSHVGKCMQLRPKASDGRKNKVVPTVDGGFQTGAKGFYLRPSFTAEILRRFRN
jgi:DNA mismatch repair protein MutH